MVTVNPLGSLVQKTKMDFKNAGGGGEMGRGDAMPQQQQQWVW